jgi:hypothetical protein
MKETVQVVALNDFEIKGACEIAGYIRQLGKGFRRNFPINEGNALRYVVEEASDSRVKVSGVMGVPRFRLIVKGSHVMFSTVGSVSPAALFYDFSRILAIERAEIARVLTPQVDVIDDFSANINDFYLVNNSYSERISEAFRRGIERQMKKEYTGGMFYLCLGTAGFGNERVQRKAAAFAESSLFDQTALAAVFCRGHGVPIYFAEGGVYYPLKEKDFCEAMQEDFSRIFMKAAAGTAPSYNISGGRLSRGPLMPRENAD